MAARSEEKISTILKTHLDFSHTRPAIFLCIFLPLCCCALPTLIFVARVAKASGIRRFFKLSDNVGLPLEPWVIVKNAIGLVIFFELLYLGLAHQKFWWRFVKFCAWTYLLTVHIISYGLFLIRIMICEREISKLGESLETVTGDQRQKINLLRELERSFYNVSNAISPYACSLIFVIIVSVCCSLGIFYQKWYYHFGDKDHGAYYFAVLSIFQAVTLWSLLAKCAGLNSGLKDLASVACRVNTDARMPPQQTVTYTVEVLASLQLIEHNVRHSRARISVSHWEVDAGMMIDVFGIHLTFVALTVGSLVSFFQSKELK